MQREPINVLVLGVGGNVSQGILKALALSELPTRVVGACVTPRAAGLFGVESAYVSPLASDPSFPGWLLETCARERIHAVLSGVEPVLERLAPLAAELRDATGAVAVVSDADALATGLDKLRTAAWLAERGLNSAPTAGADDDEAVAKLVEAHGFPLLVKPRRGKGSRGVVVVTDAPGLEHARGGGDLIVQEYLGDAESEYTVGCFVDRDGALRGSLAMRRGLGEGTTVWAEAGRFPEVRAEAERVATELRPMGPVNVQLRIHERRPTTFEVNVRFSGTTPIRARFGFNDVEAALRHFVLGEDPVDLPDVTAGFAVRYWNEIYAEPTTLAALERDGAVSPATTGGAEDWAVRR